ncbi:MAG: hypothetical protein V4491_01875 [Pseudomonadota bacterium]
MITVVIVFIGLALLFGIASSAERTARNSRRYPCQACGEPLIVGAAICPRCRTRILSGIAGVQAKLGKLLR